MTQGLSGVVGEAEQAVVSKIWEFQVCGTCYFGVSVSLGVSALGVGQDPRIPRPKPDRKASNPRHRPWRPKLHF